MGLLDGLVTGESMLSASARDGDGPLGDHWYGAPGVMTPAGIVVDADGAQKLSAWYRGRLILAVVLAMLPLPVMRRLPEDGGSEPARDMPLYDILHDQPNPWQDSFQWRMEKVFNLIDHGWTYDDIVEGPRGFVHELHPIKPSLVTPKQIRSGPLKGHWQFIVRDEFTGQSDVKRQDQVFYIRGPEGKGILERARMSIGTALATEDYSARVFGRGMLNGGTIEIPGVLNDDAGRRMALSFLTKPGEWHVPKILEQGAKWNKPDMSPEDFEMILSRKFSIDDMARWLGVPRQMLENSDPSFGNAEQFDESFLTYSMGGWLSMFESAIKSQLILDTRRYYAQFTRQAFVRGKFSERIAGLVSAAGGPIITRNEARRIEDLNTIDDPAYDKLLEQQNVTGKPSAAGNGPATVPTPAQRRPPPLENKAQAIVRATAARVLQLEIGAVQKLAVKHPIGEGRFAAAVKEFYAAHAARVADMLQLTPDEAAAYCASQSARVIAGRLAAIEEWKTEDYAQGLAAIALDEVA